MKIRYCVLAILCALASASECWAGASQPAYQVSIWLKGGSSREPTHICNGAIVHDKLILTTADCLHFEVKLSGRVQRISAPMLYVTAGSSDRQIVIQNVTSVEIAEGFNWNTLENDLAILKLNRSLPLADSPDMKWIILDDDEDHKNDECLVNFFNRNAATPQFSQTLSVEVLNNTNCSASTQFPQSRRTDICSSYFIPSGSYCNITKSSLEVSADRGSGFVCDSQLVGLLSDIIPPKTLRPRNCSRSENLFAYYTNIAPHLNWIYSKIAEETLQDFAHPNYHMAAPYNSASETAPAMSLSSTPVMIETFTTTTVATRPTANSNPNMTHPGSEWKPSGAEHIGINGQLLLTLAISVKLKSYIWY